MAQTKATKEIAHALEWLAAEFKFLTQLDQDLHKIDQEPLKDKEKELKKDKRVIRYIGKSERRLESDIQDIIKQLEKDREINIKTGKLKTILTELTIPANELISKGSLYVGDLKKRLKKIRTETAIAEKYPSKEHQDLLHTELENLDSEVKILIRWITGLDVALKKAATFFEEEIQAGIIREINIILANHLDKLRTIYNPDGKKTDPVYLYIQNDLATLEHLLFSEWITQEIRVRANINPEFINFLKNVHQALGIIFVKNQGGKDQKIILMLQEMRLLKEKLKEITNGKNIQLDISDQNKLRELYKNLIWVLDFPKRQQVPVEKLRDALVKIIKKKKIACSSIYKEDIKQELAIKLYAIPFHGIAHVQEASEAYNIMINIVKEGFVSGVQNENAINLNIINKEYNYSLFSNNSLLGIFHYFNPFGVLLTKEVNEILSSPIIPQEIIDAMGEHKEDISEYVKPVMIRKSFGADTIRSTEKSEDPKKRILNPEVISLLRKHSFGEEFDGRWAHALTNANLFRTSLNKKNRGNPPDIAEFHLDNEWGFRGWYVDKHKKIQSLKVTPKMIERIIIIPGNIREESRWDYSLKAHKVWLEQYLDPEYQRLIKRLQEEKLLTSL